jgi:hypothetical protein
MTESAPSGIFSVMSHTCLQLVKSFCLTAAGTSRAGVERVMGFCTEDEYEEFFRTVPEFEKMLVRSGIILLKYWFSITDDEQHARFLGRIHDPLKQWKLSSNGLRKPPALGRLHPCQRNHD